MLEKKPDHCTCCTPTNSKSKWFKMLVVFLAIGFCTYQFGIKPLLDERGEDIGRLLLPIIELFPFITVVPKNEVGVVFVQRPVRGSKSFTKDLKPGTYYLNPDLYKVDEASTGKQTYHYGTGGVKDD